MFLRSALGLLAIASLTSCSSFDVVQPKDGTIVTLPSATKVVIEGKPSLSGVRVTEGATDFSSQMSSVSNTRSEANLNLPLGNHALDVQGDVPCWYCSGGSFHHNVHRKICVVQPGPLMVASKTPRAKADNLSWATPSESKVGLAADTGSPSTRWYFRRLGGIASSTGLIESIEFPCRCLVSTDAAQGTPIGLAMCDANDPTQQWSALPTVTSGPGYYRFQNNGRGISDACLTEGPAPDQFLIQRACNDTPNQVWNVKDNTTSQAGVDPFQ